MNEQEKLQDFNNEQTDSFYPEYYKDVDSAWYEWHGMSPVDEENDSIPMMEMLVRAIILAVVVTVLLFSLCLAGC